MPPDLSPKAAEIAAVARTLLAARGYDGFSYADIAEAVRISKPSVHHHFPSKAALVVAVVQGYRAAAHAGLATLVDVADARDQLGAYVAHVTECVRDGTLPFCICAMLATTMATLPDEVAREVRGHFDDLAGWLAGVLARGAAAGQLRLGADARTEALSFMAATHGAMVSARAFGDPDVFAVVAAAHLERLAVPR